MKSTMKLTLATLEKCAVKIIGPVAGCNFKVPYGRYAIKTYQDIDNSGTLAINSMGKPTEGYGFSNNPNNQMGKRSWDKALFMVNQHQVMQTIHLINP